jgi:hypothetical protein
LIDKLLLNATLRWIFESYRACGNSSIGRALPCQGKGCGFESRFPLQSFPLKGNAWQASQGIVRATPGTASQGDFDIRISLREESEDCLGIVERSETTPGPYNKRVTSIKITPFSMQAMPSRPVKGLICNREAV